MLALLLVAEKSAISVHFKKSSNPYWGFVLGVMQSSVFAYILIYANIGFYMAKPQGELLFIFLSGKSTVHSLR